MNGTLGNRCAYTGSFIHAYTTVTFIYSTLFVFVALAANAVTYDGNIANSHYLRETILGMDHLVICSLSLFLLLSLTSKYIVLEFV